MKYFHGYLWKTINIGTVEEKKEAREQWRKNAESYVAYCSSITNPAFQYTLTMLNKNDGLHDFLIKKVRYDKEKREILFSLQLGKKRLRLHFGEVESVVLSTKKPVESLKKEEIGYFELELVPQGLALSVLLDFETEFCIIAKTITVE